MTQTRMPLRPLVSWLLPALLSVSGLSAGGDLGHLSGIVKDHSGKPLANLVVALVAQTTGEVLPILTRTDPAGRLQFSNIESGFYELQVKSAAYQSPQGRVVEIPAGSTASVSLVLHQLLSLGPDDRENVGIKTLLRSAVEKRVIFRTREPYPLPEERPRSPFEAASFEIYTNTGMSNADHSGETTTNFAFRDLLGSTNYVVAGQVGSAADTSWRIKNLLTYDIGDRQSLQLLMGYGRFNNGHPNIAAFDAPYADQSPYPPAAGVANVLSLGLQDRLSLGDLVSLSVGFEVNKLRGGLEQTLVSPNAELTVRPTRSTTLEARVTPKRETLGDTIDLPDGERINLADAVSLSMIDGQANSVARARFWEASLSQKVSRTTEFQLAAFRNQFFGSSMPFFALVGGPVTEYFNLTDSSQNSGYRVTLKQKFGENFKASLSYVSATADGLTAGPGEPSLLVERGALETLIRRQGFHALAAQLDAIIPATHTRLTALLKTVPGGRPVTTLDAISDYYQTGNQGLNLYVRQLVPVPISWFEFLGLDFLQGYKFEALLDIRNLTNEEFGILRTAQGNLVLVQNPRTFRGGIAVNF